MFSQVGWSGGCISVPSPAQVVRFLRTSQQSPAFQSWDLRVSPAREKETRQPPSRAAERIIRPASAQPMRRSAGAPWNAGKRQLAIYTVNYNTYHFTPDTRRAVAFQSHPFGRTAAPVWCSNPSTSCSKAQHPLHLHR